MPRHNRPAPAQRHEVAFSGPISIEHCHHIKGLTEVVNVIIQVLSLQHSKIETKLDTIMSKLSDYAATTKTQYTRINTALDDITGDITNLKRMLDEMNNNPGPISAEDQALLDEALALATGIADRSEALAGSTENPPPPPVE